MGEQSRRTSIAGEFFVMGELTRAGYDPLMTLANTKGIDIVVREPTTGQTTPLEVKSTKTGIQKNSTIFGGPFIEWRMDKKHETPEPGLAYVFVHLPAPEQGPPRYFVVSSEAVAKYTRSEHQHWLSSPHKRPINPTDQRAFRVSLGEPRFPWYVTAKDSESRWDILFPKRR